MNKYIFQAVLFLFVSHVNVMSQDTPIILIEKFFDDYEKIDISTALENLYKTNDWVGKSNDMIIQLKAKMKLELENEEFIGKMHGYETIAIKSVNSNLKLFSYLVKYDRQPIRFTFQFYRPNDKWMIYSFKYDTDLTDELEESARVYYDINKY